MVMQLIGRVKLGVILNKLAIVEQNTDRPEQPHINARARRESSAVNYLLSSDTVC